MLILTLVLSIAWIWGLAYASASASIWLASASAWLVWIHVGLDLSLWLEIPLSLMALSVCVLLASRPLRQRWLSGPLLQRFKTVLPPMSQTEQEALEAGDVWWDAELFSGRPDWNRLLRVPRPHLSATEQDFLEHQTETLCQMLDDWHITHQDQDLPDAVWCYLRQQGFFGLIIPPAFGGKGFSAMAHSEVVMKLASHSITAAVTVMVPNSLGPGKLLMHYGSEAQKRRYLPRLARGEEIPCFALTGPEAGSDAGAIPDRGVVCYGQWQGQRQLGVRLNWDKRYITLGPVCTLLGLAFRLFDPDHLLSEVEDRGLSLALIPRDTPGIEIGERHIPLDIPFQNGPNRGRDVFVPISQLVGEHNGIGRGWRMLMECLAEGRGISLPALSVGAGKMASRYTGAYAAIREQFHQPIGRFEGIEEPLARIAAFTYQMDAARTLTLNALDLGQKPAVISAIVKYHLTEKYRRCINDAMDIQGGSAICLGPANILGRAYQAIPIAITVEGANILTRSMIIFGQGALRCHPWILKEIRATQQADLPQAIQQFDRALGGHVGFLLGNAARSLWLGLTRGRLAQVPVHGASRRYFQQLQWMSAAFALAADVSMMTLGGSLKRKERLSARLGDILSELYLSSAVLKRFEDQGRQHEDRVLLQWNLEYSLYRMQESFRQLLRNLPGRLLARLLRGLIYPTGLPYSAPADHTDHEAAQILLQPGRARERLTAGIYLSSVAGSRKALLEQALQQAALVAPIQQTLKAARRSGLLSAKNPHDELEQAVAQGLIDAQQGEQIQQLEYLRRRVIQVDAFADYGQQNALASQGPAPHHLHAV